MHINLIIFKDVIYQNLNIKEESLLNKTGMVTEIYLHRYNKQVSNFSYFNYRLDFTLPRGER